MAPRRKKPRSVARNIAIVLVFFIPVLAIVLYARTINRATVLILPEEHAARETQRKSPDNAFPLLLEAAKLLPARPNPRSDGNADQGENPWQEPAVRRRVPTSISELCLVGLPDNDPQLLKTIEDCAPAAAKAHEALAKPFALFPEARRFRDDLYENEIMYLGRTMIALGRVHFDKDHTAESLTPLLDAIRMVRMLCQGEVVHSWAELIEGAALQQLRIMGTPADTAFLAKTLDALGPGYEPRRDIMKTTFLHIDDQLGRQESVQDMRPPARVFRGAFLYELQRVALILKDHKDELYTLADGDPNAVGAWLYKNTRPSRGPDDPFSTLNRISSTMRRAADLSTDFESTRLGLAIAAFKAGEGAYPATLDALVPKYLAAIPKDPHYGAPFGYKKTDNPDGYILYAYGDNGADDGGDPKSDKILGQLPAGVPDPKP